MDAAAFERVYEAFGEFHSFFAPLFGRRESRDHSQNYLRVLLVQSQDRRNAENPSESVGVPAPYRGMYKFVDLEGTWLSGAFSVLNRRVDKGIVAS